MENQSVTATADKTPEQIQCEMSQTRESLTEKVAALESQVVGTVQNAADTFSGTVEAVKSLVTSAPGAVSDTVKQAAEAVSETMKKTFDISGHVRDYPWASLGMSALAGCITGWLLSGRRGAIAPSPGEPMPARLSPPEATRASAGHGVFDELFSMLGRKLREATETAIDTASAAVNKNIREGVPKLVDAATEVATDRLSPNEPASRGFANFAG
jgi:ElaB/YqjD/DUF883 family membrane-anchored ribosome-binding protein